MPNQGRGSKGGRPPKFAEPRRPVTVTLPQRTLDQLAAVDEDRARAIVKLADAAARAGADAARVEVVGVAAGSAILVLANSRALHTIPHLRMVEIAPGRCVMALDSGTPVEKLEIGLLDVLHGLGEDAADERSLIEDLLGHLQRVRRSRSISKAEILIVDVDRPTPARGRRSRSAA